MGKREWEIRKLLHAQARVDSVSKDVLVTSATPNGALKDASRNRARYSHNVHSSRLSNAELILNDKITS